MANDTDLDFCDLPVEVSRHQGLAEKLDAVHPIVGKTIPQIVL